MKYLNEMYLEGILTKNPFVTQEDVKGLRLSRGDVISLLDDLRRREV